MQAFGLWRMFAHVCPYYSFSRVLAQRLCWSPNPLASPWTTEPTRFFSDIAPRTCGDLLKRFSDKMSTHILALTTYVIIWSIHGEPFVETGPPFQAQTSSHWPWNSSVIPRHGSRKPQLSRAIWLLESSWLWKKEWKYAHHTVAIVYPIVQLFLGFGQLPAQVTLHLHVVASKGMKKQLLSITCPDLTQRATQLEPFASHARINMRKINISVMFWTLASGFGQQNVAGWSSPCVLKERSSAGCQINPSYIIVLRYKGNKFALQ